MLLFNIFLVGEKQLWQGCESPMNVLLPQTCMVIRHLDSGGQAQCIQVPLLR